VAAGARKKVRVKKLGKRTPILVGLAAVAAIVVVGGYAYWTTGGSGTGSASVGSSSAVTIAQNGSISGLYPDGPAQNIDFTVHNGNASALRVTSVTIAIENADHTPWSADSNPLDAKPACTASDFTVTQPTTGFPVEVNGSSTNGGNTSFLGSTTGASIQLKDTSQNQDECQGVTVPFTFTAS
jgi:hypothetical protein